MMMISDELKNRAAAFSDKLESAVFDLTQDTGTLTESMRYSLTAPGKRLRPILLMASASAFGADEAALSLAETFAVSLEMIHTYSLVHDDLPAMDDDLLRRGRPTTHAVYGEAGAILCGDALLNDAAGRIFDRLSKEQGAILERGVRAGSFLMAAAGSCGMIEGQVMDLAAEARKEATLEELGFLYDKKTGALLAAALCIGAILAGADDETVETLQRAALCFGRAFQIQDDILDVTATDDQIGKPAGSDQRNEKPTWVAVAGLAEARAEVYRQTENGLQILQGLPVDTGFLEAVFESLTKRTQ